MRTGYLTVILLIFSFFNSSISQTDNTEFKLGNEVLLDSLNLIRGKNIGIITNSTGITKNGNHIIYELINRNARIIRIFTPEHGFNIDNSDISDVYDIEIVSLYGKNIDKKDLSDLDVLIYDVQDLGVRFYTYSSTLYLTIIEAAKNRKEFIICDRPSIANLNYSGGYMLDDSFSSFVGLIPVPVCYGMTSGELGLYLQDFVENEYGTVNLKVLKMQGYSRDTDFRHLNLKWINPSPNIQSVEAGRLYSSLCFLEGTNISEGRGTNNPFTLFGAPFLNSRDVIDELQKYQFEGIKFEETNFTPQGNYAFSSPKYESEMCEGVKIILSDYTKYSPMKLAVAILITLKKMYREFQWSNKNFIDKLAGTDKLRLKINEGYTVDEILNDWSSELEKFNILKEKVLLYNK